MGTINIGLIGAGTVGGGVVKIIHKQLGFFNTRLGLPVALKRIVDKQTDRFTDLPVGDTLCSGDSDDILNDESIQIVVELVGGTTFAKEITLAALKRGKHVVTANKALIAEHGPEIFEAADSNNVSVYFEAAVGGGMPTIKSIREAMVGNEISSIKTIINGTCNYILTQMSTRQLPFKQVLADAQKFGYAEADPTLDIEGGDTGHKVAIMASLLYGGYVPFERISVEGITGITPDDIACARDLGYSIKLLGIIKERDGVIDVRVHPAMLPNAHILASVSDVFNAVLLEGDAVGDMLLYGRGAGEMPTASAVVSDIIDVARNILSGVPRRIPMDYYRKENMLTLQPMESITSRYYLRFTVCDKPGVLATIATMLGKKDISIASVVQREGFSEECVPVIILTHQATEKNIQEALAEVEKMDFTRSKTQLIRIED
ncbi:MAG: homoserine dehydrogenase [Chitinivibrionales bacterium]|nr:homoserine dehydrogenase [Chitinivibrionales bacterium]